MNLCFLVAEETFVSDSDNKQRFLVSLFRSHIIDKCSNITISFVLKHQTHIEIRARLDYLAPTCPFCCGNMIKYDFQKPSTIPIWDVQGMPTLLILKKRRFQCKSCRKVVVAQSLLVKRNCQISQLVWANITQLLTESLSNAAIARQCHVSVATVQRQLENFQITETFDKLPARSVLG